LIEAQANRTKNSIAQTIETKKAQNNQNGLD
jgi:hypothetical protein